MHTLGAFWTHNLTLYLALTRGGQEVPFKLELIGLLEKFEIVQHVFEL